MESTTQSSPWWAVYVFGLVVEVLFLVALVMSYLGEDKTLLNVMCTAAVAQAGVAVNFLYGSSVGSRKKDDIMAAGGIVTKTETAGAATVTTGPVQKASDPPGDVRGPAPDEESGPPKK
jgi:hypothetical protein